MDEWSSGPRTRVEPLSAHRDLGPGRRPDHEYRRFVERHGYSLSNTEVMRHLDLPVADDHLGVSSGPGRGGRANTARDARQRRAQPLRGSLCEVMNQLIARADGRHRVRAGVGQPRAARYLDVELEMRRQRLTTVAIGGEARSSPTP